MSNRIPPELFKNILKEKNNYKRLIDKMDDVISALYSLSFGYTEEDLKEYIEINQMFFSSLTHMLKDIENNHIKALQCLIPESEWEKYKLSTSENPLEDVIFNKAINKAKKQMFNSVLQPLVQKLFDLGATPVEITELLEDNLADLGIGIKIAAEAIDEDKAKFLNDVTNLIELRIEDTNELVAGIMFSKTQGVRLGNVDEEFFDANPEYKNHFTTLLRTLESVYRKRGVTDSKEIVPAINVILEKLKSEGRLNHNFKLDILK